MAYTIATYPGRITAMERSKQHVNRQTTNIDQFDGLIDWQVEIVPDDYYHGDDLTDQLGSLSKDWSEWRVINPDHHHWNSPVYLYFHPTYSYEGRRADLQARGYSKGDSDYLARQGVYADCRTLLEYHKGDRYYVGVKVIANVDGITVGEDSLWGIDTSTGDQSDPYVAEIIADCKTNILHNVRQSVNNLVSDYMHKAERLIAAFNLDPVFLD